MNLVLASASDRRRELLHRLTNSFEIHVSDFDETSVDFSGDSEQYVMDIAEGKALSSASCIDKDAVVIGCDTAVFVDGKVLGKPIDEEDAFKMLKHLSNCTHEVYSGIALYNTRSKEILKDYVKTEVTFSSLSDNMILKYIDTGEPMDKAGAYGIRGFGGVFIERINGCYYNVVGLPLNKLNYMLGKMGVNL
jgi:septum formation protein